MITINGQETNAELFAYDGCHKIYLIEDETDKQHAIELEYDLHNINELKEVWENSCPLRFINNWKLNKKFVRQFETAEFN